MLTQIANSVTVQDELLPDYVTVEHKGNFLLIHGNTRSLDTLETYVAKAILELRAAESGR